MTRITEADLLRYLDAIKLSRPPWGTLDLGGRWQVLSASPPPGGNRFIRSPLLPPAIADGIHFEVMAQAFAAVPGAYLELAELRKWAARTVEFLRDPQSNADLINIIADAARLGVE